MLRRGQHADPVTTVRDAALQALPLQATWTLPPMGDAVRAGSEEPPPSLEWVDASIENLL
jgi:hypothetical protein